jgi:zinc transporter ZupT
VERSALLRGLALLTGAVGIVGMIVSSINSSTNGALAFGLLCVAGFLVLFTLGMLNPSRGEVDPLRAQALEELVSELRDSGADESKLRRLVRLARGLER